MSEFDDHPLLNIGKHCEVVESHVDKLSEPLAKSFRRIRAPMTSISRTTSSRCATAANRFRASHTDRHSHSCPFDPNHELEHFRRSLWATLEASQSPASAAGVMFRSLRVAQMHFAQSSTCTSSGTITFQSPDDGVRTVIPPTSDRTCDRFIFYTGTCVVSGGIGIGSVRRRPPLCLRSNRSLSMAAMHGVRVLSITIDGGLITGISIGAVPARPSCSLCLPM
jgi:hypothetical protein